MILFINSRRFIVYNQDDDWHLDETMMVAGDTFTGHYLAGECAVACTTRERRAFSYSHPASGSPRQMNVRGFSVTCAPCPGWSVDLSFRTLVNTTSSGSPTDPSVQISKTSSTGTLTVSADEFYNAINRRVTSDRQYYWFWLFVDFSGGNGLPLRDETTGRPVGPILIDWMRASDLPIIAR